MSKNDAYWASALAFQGLPPSFTRPGMPPGAFVSHPVESLVEAKIALWMVIHATLEKHVGSINTPYGQGAIEMAIKDALRLTEDRLRQSLRFVPKFYWGRQDVHTLNFNLRLQVTGEASFHWMSLDGTGALREGFATGSPGGVETLHVSFPLAVPRMGEVISPKPKFKTPEEEWDDWVVEREDA